MLETQVYLRPWLNPQLITAATPGTEEIGNSTTERTAKAVEFTAMAIRQATPIHCLGVWEGASEINPRQFMLIYLKVGSKSTVELPFIWVYIFSVKAFPSDPVMRTPCGVTYFPRESGSFKLGLHFKGANKLCNLLIALESKMRHCLCKELGELFSSVVAALTFFSTAW